MRRLGVLLIPLALLAVPLGDASQPFGHVGAGRAAQWVAFDLEGQGALELSWHVAQGNDPVGFGHAFWEDGKLVRLWSGVRAGNLLEVGVQTPGSPRVSVSTDGSGMGIHGGMRVDGQATHVFWVAGDVAAWDWEVGSQPGVVVNNVRTGSGAHLLTARDFAGGAGANVHDQFAGVRAHAAGEATLGVEHGLVGHIVSWGQDRVTREGPDGSQRCEITSANAGIMTAAMRDGCAFEAIGAGVHRFTHSGVGHGMFGSDEVYVGAIDFRP